MGVYDKKKKYEGMTFYKRPKDLRFYLYLEGINAGTLLIYDIICDFYNDAIGYAFPSQDTLSLESGMGRDTVGNHVRKLFEYKLIIIQQENTSRSYNRRRYIPQIPLGKDELFRIYPQARMKYEKAERKIDKRYAEIKPITSAEEIRF